MLPPVQGQLNSQGVKRQRTLSGAAVSEQQADERAGSGRDVDVIEVMRV
jgi:hypothetical protein